MSYQHIEIPAEGQAITANEDFSLNVPDNPVIPYIEGDGIGADISPVMIKVVDAAVDKAYQGARKIAWMEIYAGEKATSTGLSMPPPQNTCTSLPSGLQEKIRAASPSLVRLPSSSLNSTSPSMP